MDDTREDGTLGALPVDTTSRAFVLPRVGKPDGNARSLGSDASDGDCAPDGYAVGGGGVGAPASPPPAAPASEAAAAAGGAVASAFGGDSGPYPCTLDVIGASQVKGTIYDYPDGGRECVLYETRQFDFDDDASSSGSSDSSSSDSSVSPSVAWVSLDRGVVPSSCPRSAYLMTAVDCVGHVIAQGIERGVCPWLALQGRIDSEYRAGQRAKTKVRRLARANGLRYMTTLTVPLDGDRSRRRLAQLLRGFLRTRGGSRFFRHGFLAVLEPHKRGGYHLHVLHANRLPAVLVREHWTRYLLERGYSLPKGSSFIRTHEKDWGNGERAARYGAKYVAKVFGSIDAERRSGEHRYLRSNGLVCQGQPIAFSDWESALAFLDGSNRRFGSSRTITPCPVAWEWAEWDTAPPAVA